MLFIAIASHKLISGLALSSRFLKEGATTRQVGSGGAVPASGCCRRLQLCRGTAHGVGCSKEQALRVAPGGMDSLSARMHMPWLKNCNQDGHRPVHAPPCSLHGPLTTAVDTYGSPAGTVADTVGVGCAVS